MLLPGFRWLSTHLTTRRCRELPSSHLFTKYAVFLWIGRVGDIRASSNHYNVSPFQLCQRRVVEPTTWRLERKEQHGRFISPLACFLPSAEMGWSLVQLHAATAMRLSFCFSLCYLVAICGASTTNGNGTAMEEMTSRIGELLPVQRSAGWHRRLAAPTAVTRTAVEQSILEIHNNFRRQHQVFWGGVTELASSVACLCTNSQIGYWLAYLPHAQACIGR
jgi:hypothetical protein